MIQEKQLDFISDGNHEIIHGDCLDVMRSMESNSISCIVTDPPYGLKFMGKDWDHGIPGMPFWQEALRICKPGSFLLAFGGTRTYHRLTCAIEDAGWEIRDCIMWVYAQGFPKSHNHFGIEGYGTALKPAYEPIVMAMKPCEGTFKQNAEKWGQAGINIAQCRIETKEAPKGRWPANIILDEEAGKMLDEQSGFTKSSPFGNPTCGFHDSLGRSKVKREELGKGHQDSGGASRFFYCAKASSIERNEGLSDLPLKEIAGCYGNFAGDGRGRQSEHVPQKNNHPTVKPLKLMEYLIKLVMPPKDGILLDPFAGSGTTILAAKRLGFNAIGIEKEESYCEIARVRIS